MTLLSRGEIESAKLDAKLVRNPDMRLAFSKKYMDDLFDTIDGLYAENADLMAEIEGGGDDDNEQQDAVEIKVSLKDLRRLHKENGLTFERLVAITTEIEGLL